MGFVLGWSSMCFSSQGVGSFQHRLSRHSLRAPWIEPVHQWRLKRHEHYAGSRSTQVGRRAEALHLAWQQLTHRGQRVKELPAPKELQTIYYLHSFLGFKACALVWIAGQRVADRVEEGKESVLSRGPCHSQCKQHETTQWPLVSTLHIVIYSPQHAFCLGFAFGSQAFDRSLASARFNNLLVWQYFAHWAGTARQCSGLCAQLLFAHGSGDPRNDSC